jgi:hypothetical protein
VRGAIRTTVAWPSDGRRRNDGFGNVNIPSNRITANLTDACFGISAIVSKLVQIEVSDRVSLRPVSRSFGVNIERMKA